MPDRQVDDEDRPPGDRADQVAAEQRPERRRHAAQPRPGADRAGAVAGPEAGLDDRQAAGRQQGAADPLDQPGDDQQLGARRDRAEQRGGGEEADAEDEDAPPPVAVAERAAEQDQRGEGQQVAVEDPLQGAGAGAEVAADVRQGDVDDGAVEEGHPRAGDGGGEQPAAGGALEGDAVGLPAGSLAVPAPPRPSPSAIGPLTGDRDVEVGVERAVEADPEGDVHLGGAAPVRSPRSTIDSGGQPNASSAIACPPPRPGSPRSDS